MVNVELFLILAVWVVCCCLIPIPHKDIKWYKYMVRFFGKRKKRFNDHYSSKKIFGGSELESVSSHPSPHVHSQPPGYYPPQRRAQFNHPSLSERRKTLPAVRLYYFTIVWPLLLIALGISLYLYITGNCYFSRPKQFDLDDEPSDINNIRGWNVLIFSILTACLGKLWAHLFFRARRFRWSAIVLLIMILCNCVVMWAMGSTDTCPGDSINNRFWISFALYLAYTIWLVLTLFINLRWYSVLGPMFKKKNERYTLFKFNKKCHKGFKRQLRYPHHSQCLFPSNTWTRSFDQSFVQGSRSSEQTVFTIDPTPPPPGNNFTSSA